jgi:peroxiredoxin
MEMASMEKLYQRFKGKDFEMLAISVDKDISLIKPYLEKYNLAFTVLLDPKSEVAKNKYRNIGLPETYIVNKKGLILHKSIGARDWFTKELIAAFEQLTAEQ